MGIRALTRIVDACARHPRPVIGFMLALGAVAAVHSVRDFSISTDTNRLLPETLPWRHLLAEYHKEFPAHPILAVVDAPTPEFASDAVARLTAALVAASKTDQDPHATREIRSAEALGSGPFFDRNALLFPPLADTRKLAGELEQARPLLERVAPDPSLRGVAGLAVAEARSVLDPAAAAGRTDADVREGQDRVGKLLGGIADTIAAIRAGRPAPFSWQETMADRTGADARRGFIGIDPVLDYHALQPGLAASERVSAIARDLRLGERDGARVRLTGEVPINDQQFSALQQGQVTSLVGTSLAVLFILWLALRSFRIIVAVAVSLGVGFAITCSAGLLMVGSFNLLSIAFAVLFVGLGADFGIQFCVRYRAERFERNGHGGEGGRTALESALASTAEKAGVPLALAAAGTTVGFFSFLPTDYKGVSELGLIAGVGMLVAFGTTMTLLPALLAVLRPPGEAHRMGFSAFAPGDRFLSRHRYAVVIGTLVVVLAGTPLLARLHFDFDPTHMEIPTAPAVETYRDLATNPQSGIDSIDVLTPDLAAADRLGARLARLSEVKATHTASSLVPADQAPKLALVGSLRTAIGPALGAQAVPAPDDREVVAALADSASRLRALGAGAPADRGARSAEPARDAARLADEMDALARGPHAARIAAADALARPLAIDLGLLRDAIGARAVTVDTIPAGVRSDWIAPDGKARVEVVPNGDARDNEVLQRFARAVIRNAPGATSGPVSLVRSRTTVVDAFLVAGISAVLAIAVVLFIALRRIGDVLLTLLPLMVAGLVTLEIAVLIGEQLNFANIIALPLLLGVGVAFKIYYVMAWRHGATNLLQSTLTRAVLFSALTSATAFGSLWLSPEPGLSSMGKLMALALASTMAAAVLFQPALMGPPRAGGNGGRAL